MINKLKTWVSESWKSAHSVRWRLSHAMSSLFFFQNGAIEFQTPSFFNRWNIAAITWIEISQYINDTENSCTQITSSINSPSFKPNQKRYPIIMPEHAIAARQIYIEKCTILAANRWDLGVSSSYHFLCFGHIKKSKNKKW